MTQIYGQLKELFSQLNNSYILDYLIYGSLYVILCSSVIPDFLCHSHLICHSRESGNPVHYENFIIFTYSHTYKYYSLLYRCHSRESGNPFLISKRNNLLCYSHPICHSHLICHSNPDCYPHSICYLHLICHSRESGNPVDYEKLLYLHYGK